MAKLTNDYAVAVKRLASVDADPQSSHQHEITGIAAFKAVLSSSERSWDAVPWVLLDDSGDHRFETHYMRWYDSRANQPRRAPEWRLYFNHTSLIAPEDLFALIVRKSDDAIAVLSAPAGSSWESQLAALFGEPVDAHGLFVNEALTEVVPELASVAEEVLALLGWEDAPIPPEPSSLEQAINKFGGSFPPTAELSAFAREQFSIDLDDPDATLTAWWHEEEALFFGLERALIAPRIAQGFDDVEDFIRYSLSVQNRRKSRAGYAFENHLEELFARLNVANSRGKTTEGRRRPDFVLPGIEQYRDPSFPESKLTMLGVKTSCKERWRQVLKEAARIPAKHLCTLEPAISESQLQEMAEESLTIVATTSVLATYPQHVVGTGAISVSEFVGLALSLQD